MIPTLLALRDSRTALAALKAKIAELEAPHLAAIEAATGELRALARELEAAEHDIAAHASKTYLELKQQRAQALATGAEAPRTVLPAGCSVRWLSAPVVVDADQLPRAVLRPDPKLLKSALVSAGGTIPGAEMQQHPTFQWRTSTARASK